MKYAIITILVLAGLLIFSKESTALDSADFNWSLGETKAIVNIVTTCTTTTTLKYGWSLGEPVALYDSSSTCGSEEPPAAITEDPPIIIIID